MQAATQAGMVVANTDMQLPLPKKFLWLTVAVFVLAVLPFWGISRDFYDGVIAEWAYTTGKTTGLKMWLFTSNWWGHYALYQACMQLANWLDWPAWVFIKLWITIAVAGLSYEAYRLARHYGYQPLSACWVGMLTASFPSLCVLYSSSVMHFGFAWLGLLAHRWLFWHNGWRRIVALPLTLIAFQLNSNLSLLIALGMVAWHLQKRHRHAAVALAFTTISAIGFYLFIRFVHPSSGDYADYNHILLPTNVANIKKVAGAAAIFTTWGALLVLPMLAAVVAGRLFTRRMDAQPKSALHLKHDTQHIAIALMLTIAAVLPYIAVGKWSALFLVGPPQGGSLMWEMYASTGRIFHLTLDAFSTRQATTMAAPFALLCMALLHWLADRKTAVDSQRILLVGATVAVLSQLTLLYAGHAGKWEQARWEASIVKALQTTPPPAPGFVKISLSPNRPYPYPIAEGNYLLWKAYGQTKWATMAYYQNDPHWERVTQMIPSQVLSKSNQARDTAWLQYLLMDEYQPTEASCTTHFSMQVPGDSLTFLQRMVEAITNSATPAKIVSIHARCNTLGQAPL
jgi:hypothetical protein